MNWYPRATPAHPPTDLRIEVTQEAGRYGRTRVQAFDGELLVHTAVYEWSRWMGHACGQLLMSDFVAAAERERIARAQPSDEELEALPVAYLRSLTHPDWLEVCGKNEPGAFPVFASREALRRSIATADGATQE